MKGGEIIMSFNNLLVEIESGIAVVTINRPKSLNALNSETLSELNECFTAIEQNPEVSNDPDWCR